MFNAYLKIDGVPGESQANGYENQIEVLSFSHGIHQPTSMSASTAGGAATGRSEHSDFSFVKQLDKASPILALKCSDGSHIKEAVLTLVRAGGDQVPFMEYKMESVLISGFRPGGSSQGDGLPMEELSLNYGKIAWTYTLQKRADGSPGGKTAASWNLEKYQTA